MARPTNYNITINLFTVSYSGMSYTLSPKNWNEASGSIVVEGVDLTPALPASNSITISPLLTDVYSQQTTQLSVGSAGFKTYTNSIQVFGYDIVLNLYLLPVDADFTYARFNRIESPYNSDIYFYNAVSGAGSITYTIDDTDLSISSPNIVHNSQDGFDIDMTARLNEGGLTYTNTFTSSELGNPLSNWYPAYSTNVTTPLLDPTCTYLGGVNNIYAYADFSALRQFNISGTPSVFPHTLTILRELIDIEGNVVLDDTYVLALITTGTTQTSQLWQPVVPNYGDFTVRSTFTLSDKDGTDIHTCVLENRLKTQYWFDIQRADCNNIKFTNLSDSNAILTVSILEEVNNVKQWTVVQELGITLGENESGTIELKGVYKVTVNHASPIETVDFLIVNYCHIQQCLETVINNVMCGNMKVENLRRILPVMYLHASELHNEYVNNYYYELPLLDSKIQELWTIKETAERLELYCEDCTDYKNGCGC